MSKLNLQTIALYTENEIEYNVREKIKRKKPRDTKKVNIYNGTSKNNERNET